MLPSTAVSMLAEGEGALMGIRLGYMCKGLVLLVAFFSSSVGH